MEGAPPAGIDTPEMNGSAMDFEAQMRLRRRDSEMEGSSSGSSQTSAEPTPIPKLISLNFKGAPLNTVLDYLAESTGYSVVRGTTVEGTVDVISPTALSTEDALELVTTVLYQRGYAALRVGKTLTIVKRDDASKRNVPVRQGADPEEIPLSDQIVTQIIPVRYSRASELVDNIKPLLPENSIITANQGSNAIILTDSQMNVRRVVEIISALDKSFSEITTVRAFTLQYADAKATATLITTLFQSNTATGQNGRNNGGTQFRGPGGPFGGNRGGDSSSSDSSAAALQASSRIAAGADERTNTLVVAAPGALMPAIEELLTQIDKSTDVLTEVRVFPLKYADAQEMATLVTSVFAPSSTTTTSGSNNNNRGQRFFQFGGFGGFRGQGGNSQQTAGQSERQQAEDSVVAVADTRTNSIVVSAVGSVLDQVEQVVKGLDRDPSGTKKVHVYELKNARPEEVSALIEEMFGTSTSSSTTTRSSNNNTRSNNTGTRNNNNRNTGN
ncbi:hypothetical protein GC173_05880 [bacterium]|nr:hypothetical protein [bacterium]